jgi:hypothetical protein
MSVPNLLTGKKGFPYAFPMPLLDIKEDIVTPFCAISEWLRNHHVIFRQPELQLLVIPPITIVAVLWSQNNLTKYDEGWLTVLALPSPAERLRDCCRT